MIYTRFYSQNSLPFNRAEALRYFGYPKNVPLSKEVQAVFEECINQALSVCSYKICYAEFDVVNKKEEKVINLGFTETSSLSLVRNLCGCNKVIAFAATVGVAIDRLIGRYSALFPLKAYAFQAIGTERIETLCDCFEAEIRREYEAWGVYTARRFSCGYGDFPLEKQSDFFAALDCSRKIGLTLNDNFLMSPSKSVTAIIGVGKSQYALQENACDLCNYSECSFKRRKE